MNSEFKGSILAIREVEDCIRATKKYTKGAFRRQAKHPIQGEDFPSKVITEYYEVYPDVELSWDMPASVGWAWVWGDVKHLDVIFEYDYRADKAAMRVLNGIIAVKELSKGVPGFSFALAKVIADGNGKIKV